MDAGTLDRFRGCLLGLAVGDAVGAAVEFKPRGTFEQLIGMKGGGPFGLEAGQWTDDTSMALCLATSLVECGDFDAADQMARYCRWWKRGYLSSTGTCFDIGGTVLRALHTFEVTGNPMSGPTEGDSAGNGSIMRLAPVPMFFFADRERAITMSEASSRTTHGARECIDACRLFGLLITRALEGQTKEEVLAPCDDWVIKSDSIRAIARGSYRGKSETEIAGTGYVVRSLEAALWSFWSTASFDEAVLRAANLGDDADTTAAVCGQLAGAHYGKAGIPAPWLEQLYWAGEIEQLSDQLAKRAFAVS